jgi:aspartate/methionine/tyrosine aminotransferase
MLTEPLAPYMLWAKTRTPAAIDLAGSNLLSCSVDDLPGAREALELTAPNDNGFAPLRVAIAAHLGVPDARVVTATGCSGANFLAIAALVGAGDDVLVEQPGYDPLVGACALMGARVTRFGRPFSRRFTIDLDEVRSKLTSHTRLIIVTSPHNPSGTGLDQDTLTGLVSLADSVGAHLLVDEVYLDAVNLAAQHGGRVPTAAHLDGPVIVTSSLTKSYGLNGLRCGWAVAPAEVVDRLWRVRDLVEAVGSAVSDRLAAFAFTQMPRLRERTQIIVSANLELARGFTAAQSRLALAAPPSATVLFPKLLGVDDTDAFVTRLALEHGVAVAAGRYFDAPAHFRISLAGATVPLADGLSRLSHALRALQ